MLYTEFLSGTKAKDNANNYEVYKALEVVYMNREELTKEDIFTAAAGLLDNSETPAEKELRETCEKLEKQIKENAEAIKFWKDENKHLRALEKEEAEIFGRKNPYTRKRIRENNRYILELAKANTKNMDILELLRA